MSQYQIVVKGLLNNAGTLRNIHHYDFPSYVPTTTNLQAFIDEFDSNLKTRLQAYYASVVNIYAYGVRRVDVADQPEADFVPTAGAWNGSDAGDMLPAPNAALLRWTAPTQFPRNSWIFLFPMGESSNTGPGSILAATRSAVIAYGGDILTVVVPGADAAVRIAVRYTAAPRIISSFNVLTTVLVPTTWRTQRGRRLGVGS